MKVVAFGGGTGLSALVRGLVRVPAVELTAVVAVCDDGGSTGRLRDELRLPAVGDCRACLSAAAGAGWGDLLEHRFTRGTLEGHALGNLLLAAALEQEGALSRALARLSRLAGARARVLPATDADAELVATLADGRVVRGQRELSRVTGPVERLRLSPERCDPAPGVLEAIEQAELVVLGPGSLFSSVVASALAVGVAQALARSPAPKLLVQNLTTQRGETDELSVAEHLRAVRAHLGRASVDVLLAHQWNGVPPPMGLVVDPKTLEGVQVRVARLAADAGRGRVHEPALLAQEILNIAAARAPATVRG